MQRKSVYGFAPQLSLVIIEIGLCNIRRIISSVKTIFTHFLFEKAIFKIRKINSDEKGCFEEDHPWNRFNWFLTLVNLYRLRQRKEHLVIVSLNEKSHKVSVLTVLIYVCYRNRISFTFLRLSFCHQLADYRQTFVWHSTFLFNAR